MRRSMLAISSTPTVGDAKEAERLSLAQCRCNGRSINAILDEILERHRQLTVVIAAVVAEFQLGSETSRGARTGTTPCRQVTPAFRVAVRTIDR